MNISMFKVGTRFTLHGAEYEITYMQYGEVRYSATAGGRSYKVGFNSLKELCESGKVSITFISEARLFVGELLPRLLRRRRYVEAAIGTLLHPTAKGPLARVIARVSAEMSDVNCPSVSAVSKWIRAYQLESDDGLIDKKRTGNCTLRFDPIVEQLINDGINEVYLVRERRTALDVLAFVVGKSMEMGLLNNVGNEIKIPSIRTINRRLRLLDEYVVLKAKKGSVAAQRFVRSSGRAFGASTALSMVQIDTHYMDILVVDPESGEVLGRPYLICILCIKTRMVVGLYISLYPPSAVTFLGALTNMLVSYGVPSMIIPDNGTEIKNTTFSAVCEKLGITISQAQVRDPNGKAHIESFFRTLTYGITQKIPGTTFSNTTQLGDYNSQDRAELTLVQIRELTEEWISQIYHKTVHSRSGRAPLLAWEDDTKMFPPLKLTSDYVEKVARKPIKKTVHNGKIVNKYIEYFSHSLSQYDGRSVVALVDELNLDFVYVVHPEDKSIYIKCESTDPEYTRGLSMYEHEEAKKIKDEMSKSDLKRLGKYSGLFSRYLLLEKIHNMGAAAKRLKRKIFNGESTNPLGKYNSTTCTNLEKIVALENIEETDISESDYELCESYESIEVEY